MQQKEMVKGDGVWHIKHQVIEVFQQETQAAGRKINWRRHRPKKGSPMKEESLILWMGKRRRMSQETPRNNQQSMKDRTESWSIARFVVWKNG